jgi:hypothetical protein
VLRNPWG